MGIEEGAPQPEEVNVKSESKPVEEKLISIDIFPDKVRKKIDGSLKEGEQVLVDLEDLKKELVTDRDKIQAVLAKPTDETDPFAGATKYVPLAPYYEKLSEIKTPDYNPDLACRELLELRSQLLNLRAECRDLLGETTDSLAPDHLETSIENLKKKIAKDQDYINGENVASHVTGYQVLIKILKSGSLEARAEQGKSREPEVTFKKKGSSEENQIVFDMTTIRRSYARGKDHRGREEPVIILKRARDLMTEYQFIDSDGRHFFGPSHNPQEKQYDPFVCGVEADNTVVLVPEIYKPDLTADLAETAKNKDVSVDEICQQRGVVFITSEQYMVKEGELAGNMFSGIQTRDEVGRHDRKVVESLLEIGRQKLYNKNLPRITGRIVPTGNICEGAGGVEQEAFTFKEIPVVFK